MRFNDYLLENVYLRTTDAQRAEIMALWQQEGAVPDPAERARRSREVVFMVRNAAGELAGLCTVGLTRVPDGRVFYAYRMFLRPQDRMPYLMWAVTDGTRDFLRGFTHPDTPTAGLYLITENPKLMRPGMKRSFQRHGYSYRGKTVHGLDVWVAEFAGKAIKSAFTSSRNIS